MKGFTLLILLSRAPWRKVRPGSKLFRVNKLGTRSDPLDGGPGTVCIMVANAESAEFSSRFSIERYVTNMANLVKVAWGKFWKGRIRSLAK